MFQEGVISYTDKRYIINHEHYRNVSKQHFNCDKNGTLLDLEKKSGDSRNGLSSIEYKVLSTYELAPRFTVINVDFNLNVALI